MNEMQRMPLLLAAKPRVSGNGGIRLVAVDGDNMEPTLRVGDAVGVVPVDGFSYDGVYVVDFAGRPCVYRCSSDFRGGIVLTNDNKIYSSYTMSPGEFENIVIGQVAVLCKVVDRTLMEL